MRGSGKSAFCSLAREEFGALGREDRRKFKVPVWQDFKKKYPDLSQCFLLESHSYRHYKTKAGIHQRGLRRQRDELCLWMALKDLDKKTMFMWDKGLLEVLMYYQIHGQVPVSDAMLELWPRQSTLLIQSNTSFERAVDRPRNVQWDKNTYNRAAKRHASLMKKIPHTVVLNNGSLDDLRLSVHSLRQ